MSNFGESENLAVGVGVKNVLQNETKSKLPPVDEWERFDGTPKVGMFYTFDLKQTRKLLLESGRNPKITLKSGSEIASLQYRCVQGRDGDNGLCHIRELPIQKHEIENFLRNLPKDIEWKGEGIHALTQRCLLHLIKAERHSRKNSNEF